MRGKNCMPLANAMFGQESAFLAQCLRLHDARAHLFGAGGAFASNWHVERGATIPTRLPARGMFKARKQTCCNGQMPMPHGSLPG